MTPDAFYHYWETTYPAALPVGYSLREKYAERWFRIHTLPESKRYVDSEEEHAEILRRHNALLADTIGGGQSFVLVLTGYSETPRAVLLDTWLKEHYPDSRPFVTVQMNTSPDPRYYWHFFMVTKVWEPHLFDDLLRLVADDVIANVLFVGIDQVSVYAPYDGGADVILSSPSTRDTVRQRYTSWFSTDPTGL